LLKRFGDTGHKVCEVQKVVLHFKGCPYFNNYLNLKIMMGNIEKVFKMGKLWEICIRKA
jgi:hypothetical protein